ELTTYGIGKDISWKDWQLYIIQLINLGYVEIAFHLHNHLQLTPMAKDILFNGAKLELAKNLDQKEIKEDQAKATKTKDSSLFEKLRLLRLGIAQDEGIPAYLIFNDATLKEMEKNRPMTDEDFMQINGVGRKKMEDYGYQFIKEIIAFSKEKRVKKKPKSGNTHKETLQLYNNGLSVEEISETRKLAPSTINSHLVKLYEEGEKIDLAQLISKADIKAVRKAKESIEDPKGLKSYYEYFDEALDYWTIKFALTILEKEDK
ncbi:MAG TPA: helix-turn-helix domain-containing protein, partial [Gillisia sp.]|nr:helix-turn-helix domain-containing protein [Gillisia sp.]